MESPKTYYALDGTPYNDINEMYLRNKDIMSKGVYLYGKPIKGLSKMGYEDALKLKIEMSKALVGELLKVSFMESDNARINASLKSQKFNEALLQEMYENDNLD